MANHFGMGRLIDDLDRLMGEVGKSQSELNSTESRLTKMRRDLWEIVMDLYTLRLICFSADSSNDEQGVSALRQLSQFADAAEPSPLHKPTNTLLTHQDLADKIAGRLRTQAGRLLQDPKPEIISVSTLLEIVEVAQRAQGAFEVLRLRQDLVDEIDKRIGERIENLLRGPVLDNYRGFVCARFTNETSPLQAGQGGELEVWLQPERPAEEVPAEAIDIRDGRDFEQATFEIALDSDDIKFKPRRLTLTVQPDEASSRLFFPFVAPAKAGEHKVWVQVFQKNRLIQVVEATIQVEAKGD